MTALAQYRISGHESFACRYTWLPKAVRGISEDPELFADDDDAMVRLGVGKNMVRSIKFWAQASGVLIGSKKGAYALTPFGSVLLGENGLDPFLEDVRTLWLIHWNMSTDPTNPLLAWEFLLSRWQAPELVPASVIPALKKEAALKGDAPSDSTIEQHWETFLHTYVPTRGRKGEVQEDNLDCPLVELELIVRKTPRGGDPIYAFRREEKPDITDELFAYCLNDFWTLRHPTESTLAFKEVAHGAGSPGQVFKLPEEAIRARVEALGARTHNQISYVESANLQQVRRFRQLDRMALLKNIFQPSSKTWLKNA